MVCDLRLKKWMVFVATGFWLFAPCSLSAPAHGSLLEELCRPDADGGYDIGSLAEEAEAAGMSPHILKRLLVKGYRGQTAASELGRLFCLIIRAEEDGFLPDPLFLKLEEGLAKNASLSNIKMAVERKIEDMEFAQRLVSGKGKPRAEDDNVVRIVRAISAGLTRQDLHSLFSRHGDAPVDMRVTAAELLAYGNAIGFDVSLLDRIVATGLTSRSLRDEWTYFVKVVAKARKRNIPDQRVADQTIKTLSQNGTLNDLISALGMKPADVY